MLKNEIAFLGNTFPLEITLSAQQCKGERIQVEFGIRGKKIHTEIELLLVMMNYQKVKI